MQPMGSPSIGGKMMPTCLLPATTTACNNFLGMWRFIGDGGSAAGPMIVGQVAQMAGLHLAPIVIAGIGFMGAGVLGGLVPETLKRE